MQMLKEQKKTRKDLETELKDYYALVPEDLPELQYQNGEKASPIILTYVLTAHEKQEKIPYGNPIVKAKSEVPGICDEAAGIIAGIDSGSLQKALVALAAQYLEEYTNGKKVFLPYPICRYADETTMRELTSRAPKWATSVSGINAPALKNFRQACLYSETREAMLFADKMGDLDAYAKIRGTTADMIRDQYLSDVGLAPDGTKSYDLGNQTVTARLQKDLSFAVELAEGKPAKSLPKKGADPDKYEIANADFSEMKKAVKKIVKNRVSVLFDDFLNNHSRAAVEWKAAYLDNPVLRTVASLLVWKQNRSTFIVTDTGIIKADGSEYVISDKNKISIAHPMDMSADDVAAWQKYFTAHGLKQPFMQIWEPVIAPETIMNDRYKGCIIPYYRFVKQEKHGIYVSDENFHNEISISFDDCYADVERIDWLRHMIEMNHNFEVTLFKFKKYTRKVNHVVAYLDRVTVYGRILKDDVSIASQMDRFTLAQITEFINAAIENNCTNVTALLLDYKNKCFSDFEPMDEFVLE